MNQLPLFDDGAAVVQRPARRWSLYVDGASRGNPGLASVGTVLVSDGVRLCHGYYIGTATNNYAEYAALVVGLSIARAHVQRHDTLAIIADSQLLIRQVDGIYKVRHPQLQIMHERVRQLLQGLVYTVRHVPRELNTAADACANKALNEKTPLPAELQDLYVPRPL